VDRIGFSNQILRHIRDLRYARQPLQSAGMNKAG
jgi:hypothetical protein